VAAEPADISDIHHLTRLYAPGITIAPEILQTILKASHGSLRRICVNLDQVRELAMIEGLAQIGKMDWGKRQFFTGEAPAPRRAV
ncbi:MAG: ATP-binding protein, partial [Pseudomonadota bacterium]